MPLTSKGSKIRSAMQTEYGQDKGDNVFYASQNKGTITGTHRGKAKHAKGNPHMKVEVSMRRQGASDAEIQMAVNKAEREHNAESQRRDNPY
jgi:hypothetical protein